MDDEINRNIIELENALRAAGLNYEIWWVYKEKESRKRFLATLNAYPLFFQTSLHAHFVAMIISLYRVYETRRDTINFPQLIKKLKKHSPISNKDMERITSNIDKIKPLWVKVSVLRNKMFAHRSNDLDYDEIWEEAKIKPNQFKELIDESKRILKDMNSLWDRSSHSFNLTATEDTVELLEDLKRLKESRL